MEGFSVILNSVLKLACMIVIGFIVFRTGYLKKEHHAAISKIVVNLTLPLLVVMALTGVELTPERVKNSVFVLLGAFLSVAVLFLLGGVMAKLFRLPTESALIHKCMTAFGNVGFLGYPLILSLYGKEGLFYAALYGVCVNDMLVWTYVVYQLCKQNGSTELSKKERLKRFFNPPTIAFFIALFMLIFGLRVPGVLGEVFDGIGGMTTYLSMIFVGGVLANADFKKLLHCASAFSIVAVKMLLVPLFVAFVIKDLPFDPVAKGALVMQIAVPSQTIISILTSEYGGDVEYVIKGIFVTTLSGLVTLPFVYYLFSQMI